MQGVHAYGSVLDIPEPVDLAVVTVPAARVAEVVESCGAKGVHGLVVMTGFSDDQIDGPEARRNMVSAARAAGMRVVGPSCLGVVNTDPRVRMNASLAPVVPPPGRIGFFCQSGALGVAILADAAARGLGLSTFVSAGDRADVSGNDLLQFWHGDDRTEVVLLYLESFGNPRKFARLARVLGKTKPVIAVKSGRHVRTTVGLAGNQLDDAVVGTLFEQSGVIRTPGLTDAFDVAQLLSTQPVPAGNRVGIVGNSKALGVLAVDFCLDAELQVTDDSPTDLGVTCQRGGVRNRRAPGHRPGPMWTPWSSPGYHLSPFRERRTRPRSGTRSLVPRSRSSPHSWPSTALLTTWRSGTPAGTPGGVRSPPTARWSGRSRRCPTRSSTGRGCRVLPAGFPS